MSQVCKVTECICNVAHCRTKSTNTMTPGFSFKIIACFPDRCLYRNITVTFSLTSLLRTLCKSTQMVPGGVQSLCCSKNSHSTAEAVQEQKLRVSSSGVKVCCQVAGSLRGHWANRWFRFIAHKDSRQRQKIPHGGRIGHSAGHWWWWWWW